MKEYSAHDIKIFEDIIVKLYQECYSQYNVHKWVMETLGLKTTRAYEYIKNAKEYFAEFIVDKNNDVLLESLEVMRQNRQKAADLGNLKEVRECTIEISKLSQLYIKKVEQDLTLKMEQPLFGEDDDDDDDDD